MTIISSSITFEVHTGDYARSINTFITELIPLKFKHRLRLWNRSRTYKLTIQPNGTYATSEQIFTELERAVMILDPVLMKAYMRGARDIDLILSKDENQSIIPIANAKGKAKGKGKNKNKGNQGN